MARLRRLLRQYPSIGLTLIAVALAVRVLIPTGFMPAAADGVLTVQLCSGYGPETVQITIPGLPAKHDDQNKGMKDMPCAFSGLSSPSLSAADPVLLVLAILFATALVRHRFIPRFVPVSARLRPPLRGPPTA